MPGAVVFLADLLQGFHTCTVIVKKAVDALITSQRVECLGNIGYGVQHHASNYKWWSRGGTVTLGKAHSFKIEVVFQDGTGGDETTEEKPGEDAGENVESPFVIENGILTGIKDPSLTQVVLPAEVKSIASGAFRDSHIESLVLNEGLEVIELQAFSGSQKLASVAFPASLKEIGGHAFEDCVALTEVDLSKTALQEISSDAFRETGL